MDKNGVVTFSNWNKKGMQKHPLYGLGLVQNLEIFENKGLASLAPKTTLQFSPSAFPIAMEKDIYNNIYTATAITGIGVVYKGSNIIQSGLSNIWDMKIWKDYLWVRHSTLLSAYGPLSAGASAQWFGTVASGFNGSYWGKLLVGQDDFLYAGNGNSVAKITYSTGGTIGVAPTVSTNLTALDLKDGQFVTTLVEYGTKIMIATGGGAGYNDMGQNPNGKLYPWNRQLGTLGNPGLADLPVDFNENGIYQVITHANRMFVVAGTLGNVYESDGTNYRKIATLPVSKQGILSPIELFPNAIGISNKGTLLIGVVSLGQYTKGGVYEIDISDPEFPCCLKNTISTGNIFSTAGRVGVGVIYNSDYQTLYIGWRDDASYGVDNTSFTLYTSYGGVIETELVPVGSYLKKKSFAHLEWCLSDPLVLGQNIRISYRKNNTEDYTLIGTWGFTTATGIKGLGSVLSFEDIAGIADCEYVQLKIELDQAVSAIYGSNINLISAKIW